jgi:hypothetical protein
MFLPVLLAAALAATATAQQAKLIANWANLNQLVPGSEIRVTLANGKTVRGFVVSVTPESLVVNSKTSQETLARQDIRRVALKRRGHRGRNTLIGLGVGTGAGLAIGAGLDARHDTHAFMDLRGCWPLACKAVGTPLGALVGAAVGVALPTGGWRDVYRAP